MDKRQNDQVSIPEVGDNVNERVKVVAERPEDARQAEELQANEERLPGSCGL